MGNFAKDQMLRRHKSANKQANPPSLGNMNKGPKSSYAPLWHKKGTVLP
jgi:hypothetical protein